MLPDELRGDQHSEDQCRAKLMNLEDAELINRCADDANRKRSEDVQNRNCTGTQYDDEHQYNINRADFTRFAR